MSEFKPVEAYAMSTLAVLGSRMEEHQAKYKGLKPRCFIMHRASIEALEDEMQRRFGGIEKTVFNVDPARGPRPYTSFMGIIIGMCPIETPECGDQYIDCNGEAQPL